MESSPITTDDESYFGASWLRSTQAPLISRSTGSAKLLFFQKATAVVVIVEFVRFQDYKERREGAYFRELTVHPWCKESSDFLDQ